MFKDYFKVLWLFVCISVYTVKETGSNEIIIAVTGHKGGEVILGVCLLRIAVKYSNILVT